ncbi:ribosomal RNA small subunit methyltransferase A [Oleiharenicola lentus]|uniref:Ribosomal RNA small subunit methyltransferase A n=1 Tax=Oleiharenicola lentus TaxID=2508720 RepID=A0A4Q1CAL5_9BACT|nr:16S rRNA (adenine(1518)-N(6)/adenine(1519)-N(6))-dimethyltransferase RsmA [Oleiharenicola lentus]RXK56125.1 ribosomal RNA small subunit methyltransferase A [Oleiharenicola lentus]
MPLTPTGTRELLAKLGHQPKRFLGQNFLVDGNIVRKSLDLAGIKAGDTVVEVGPGLGTLTSALLEAGAEVWAVEKDRQLHAHLTETLVPSHPRLHLMEGDAMDFPLAGFDPVAAVSDRLPADTAGGHRTALPTKPFKIVANLPYAISTPWMDAVLSGPLPDRMVLMLQLEAAERYVAKPGTKLFGAISIFLQSAFALEPGHRVPAACFHPRPDIESVLLNLARLPEPFIFPAETKALIRACFQQRRKQLGSILRGKLAPEAAARWFARLEAAGFSAQSRAEQVPVALWRDFAV